MEQMEEEDMAGFFQPQTNRSPARWQGINRFNEHITWRGTGWDLPVSRLWKMSWQEPCRNN